MALFAYIPATGPAPHLAEPLAGIPALAHSILRFRLAQPAAALAVETADPALAAIARQFDAGVITPVPGEAGMRFSPATLAWLAGQGAVDGDVVVRLNPDFPLWPVHLIETAAGMLATGSAGLVLLGRPIEGGVWETETGGTASRKTVPVRQCFQEVPALAATSFSVARQGDDGAAAFLPVDAAASWRLSDSIERGAIAAVLAADPSLRVQVWPDRLDLIVFDFDGVMTDNRVHVDQDGRESVACNRADGWGLARLREKGIPMMVLSTEENPVVAARCAKLRLDCHQGVADKARYLREFVAKSGLDLRHVAFVGNDVNDLGCLRVVGLPVAVADSHPDVLKVARLVLGRKGGDAAVREFCDVVLARLSA